MRKITFLKTMLLAVILLAGSGSAWGQLFTESFNYTPHATDGIAKQSLGVWKKNNTGDSILVEAGNLSYPGFYTSTGNRVIFGGAGTDYYALFSSQTSGTVYLSFLLNISSLGSLNATGGYAIGFIDAGTTNFLSRVFIRLSGTNNFNLGIQPGSISNVEYASNVLSTNTTYLVVVSYNFVSGQNNDISRIWINPTLGSAEPTSDKSVTGAHATAEATSIQRVFLRQDGTNSTPSAIIIDEIRVGTTWASVTPTINFTGTGEWTEIARWNTGVVPTSTERVIIDGDATINSNVEIAGLTINSAKSLIVNPGKQLTITGTATNNGTIKLLSDATNGTATLKGDVTGNAEVQQYLSSARNWYMSSPVAAAALPSSGYTLYSYPETSTSQATNAGNFFETPTGNFGVMTGYIVKPTAATTITFTGTLNNGNQSIGGLTNTAANPRRGFNLVGNPYPSYVNWNAATKTELSNTMWYRTHDGTAWKFYTYNGTSAGIVGGVGIPAGVTNLIPPMQAFWVKVNADQTGSLAFTNAMREHQDNVDNKFRAPAASNAINQILRLQVSGNSITDEAVVYFNDNAVNTFDTYDSPKMMNGSTSTVPDIYTTIGTEELAINGMKTIPYEVEIPVYFKANASTAGTFTLKANEISSFEDGTKVYIKNNLTSDQHLISDGSDYVFAAADATNYPAFSLIFKAPGAVTALANTDNNKVLVFANANRQITVTLPSVTENAFVLVYNAVGQKLYSSSISKATTLIDNSFTPGVYVVNVNNVSKKVIVK